MSIPTIKRPFDDMETDEERLKYMMAEMEELKVVEADGIDFAGKTAMWVAYERALESARPEEERLFCDPLAKHFGEPYGKRLSTIFAFGLKHAIFDPPGADIGFHYEGHVMYTAARTKLINDRVSTWLAQDQPQQQVVNLGAGTDTRVYWVGALSKAALYVEVDTAPVLAHKDKILTELEAKGELPKPFCCKKTIALDFAVETIKDLPSHGYQQEHPTCWILEGLVMYLQRPAIEQLMDDVSALSAAGSYLILNFSDSPQAAAKADDMDEMLVKKGGWTQVERVFFGDEQFSFNRYPAGKPANKIMGFAMYRK
eukprot:m.63118 g.63118  ORF g.63118 m.63118 type:complete len:313 (+) comp13955_c0_seq1:79-1017(+)